MKVNKVKAGHRYETLWANIREVRIQKNKNKTLLEVIIDRNLNFDDYVFTLCKKAGRKMSALARIYSYMSLVGKEFFCKRLWNHDLVAVY